MTTITWLAEVVRSAGVQVSEVEGWQSRGGAEFNPIGILWHHTATPSSAANPAPTLNYVTYQGRVGLDPPLCHALVDYNGVFHIVSGNRANHAGATRVSGPIPAAGSGNGFLIGWEIDYSGSVSMTQAQYNASIAATVAVLKKLGRDSSYVRGHKETSVNGKSDPGLCDMNTVRSNVAALLANGNGGPTQIYEAGSGANWQALPIYDPNKRPVMGQSISAVRRSDGVRLVYYLNGGQVYLTVSNGWQQYMIGNHSGVSQISALQVGSVSHLYSVRNGLLHEATSATNWAPQVVGYAGVPQRAQKVAAVRRTDGVVLLYVLQDGRIYQLASDSSWQAVPVPNHMTGDIIDVAAVAIGTNTVVYALRQGGWVSESGSSDWVPRTIYSSGSPVLGTAISAVAMADGSRALYTVNRTNIYEAGSANNWANLRVGTQSGMSSVSAIVDGSGRVIYSR